MRHERPAVVLRRPLAMVLKAIAIRIALRGKLTGKLRNMQKMKTSNSVVRR
jgi:hypothetical protein